MTIYFVDDPHLTVAQRLRRGWECVKLVQKKIDNILCNKHNRLLHIEGNIKNGKDSNIPECCILFYIGFQLDSIEKSYSYFRLQNKVEALRNCRFKYKACPNCLLNGNPSPLKVTKNFESDPDCWYCLSADCPEITTNVSGICDHCTSIYKPPTTKVELSQLKPEDFEVVLSYPYKLKSTFVPDCL